MAQLGKIEAVKCDICGFLHEKCNNKNYIEIHGNITIGSCAGLIGNNFDDDGKLNRSFIICDNMDCLTKFFRKLDVNKRVTYIHLEHTKILPR